MTQVFTLSGSLIHSRIENQMEEECLGILRRLFNVQYKKHHKSLSKGLLEGTGSCLFLKPRFIEWRDSSVSLVLGLHGIRRYSIPRLVGRSLNGIEQPAQGRFT